MVETPAAGESDHQIHGISLNRSDQKTWSFFSIEGFTALQMFHSSCSFIESAKTRRNIFFHLFSPRMLLCGGRSIIKSDTCRLGQGMDTRLIYRPCCFGIRISSPSVLSWFPCFAVHFGRTSGWIRRNIVSRRDHQGGVEGHHTERYPRAIVPETKGRRTRLKYPGNVGTMLKLAFVTLWEPSAGI